MKVLCSLLALALALTACKASDEEVTVREVNTVVEQPATQDETGLAADAERFGYRMTEPAPKTSQVDSATSLKWSTPEGWTAVESTPTRDPNFIINGNDQAQCYVTVLQGSGGGMLPNINRWRQQLGLEPLDEAGLALLDRIEVLGQDGIYTELEGSFSGMGSADLNDAKMFAAAVVGDQQSIFVKMIGPKDVIEGQTEAFKTFVASLESAPAQQGSDPHAGLDMSMMGGMGGMGGAMPPSHPPIPARDIEWIVPADWTTGDQKPMRLATFHSGEENNVEISVIMLSGTAGGTVSNIQRWYDQMGQTVPTAEELENVETIEVLGNPSPIVEIHGSFSGMGHEDLSDATMLALICPLEGNTLFVKALGPTEAVVAQREAFSLFCQSMVWQDQPGQ